MQRAPILLVSVALAFGAAGCRSMKDLKGYITDEQIMSMIQPGVDNRDSVQKTLGRPTVASSFDSKTWYYVSRQTEQLAFLYPKAKTQQVVIVRFDDKGNVSKVEKQGLEQIVSVDPSDDKTPTRGKEVSALEQIFGNIGRYSPAGAGSGQQ